MHYRAKNIAETQPMRRLGAWAGRDVNVGTVRQLSQSYNKKAYFLSIDTGARWYRSIMKNPLPEIVRIKANKKAKSPR